MINEKQIPRPYWNIVGVDKKGRVKEYKPLPTEDLEEYKLKLKKRGILIKEVYRENHGKEEKSLPRIQSINYLEKPDHCPLCGSENIYTFHVENGSEREKEKEENICKGDKITFDIECFNCDFVFKKTFIFEMLSYSLYGREYTACVSQYTQSLDY